MADIIALTLPYAEYSFPRALEGIAAAGYKHIGLRIGAGAAHAGERVAQELTEAEGERVRAVCNEYGLNVSTLFGASVMKEDVDDLVGHLRFARGVGAPSLLWLGVWGYHRFPDEPFSEEHIQRLHEQYVEKMKQVAVYAEQYDIVITLKPHGGNTATGPILRKTLDDIGSPFVQASYDPGNVMHYEGIEPEDGIDAVRDVSFSLVMKDHHKGEGRNQASLPGDGKVDFVHILKRLKDSGFRGPLIVEKVHDKSVDGDVSAEELDRRMARARTNVIEIAERAGYELADARSG